LNKWLVAITFSVLLLVPAGAQNAFGGTIPGDVPVSIVFKGIVNDCKIIQIDQGFKARTGKGAIPLLIKNVNVDVEPPNTIKPGMPITIDPPTNVLRGLNPTFAHFDYKTSKVTGPTATPRATLTVCPETNQLVFTVTVVTSPPFQIGKLIVHETRVDAPETNSFAFENQFVIKKELPTDPAKCFEKVDIFDSTNVEKNTLVIECRGISGGRSLVTISGNPIDEKKPAILGVVIDPLGDTFLLITEVCILNVDDSFVCPTDIDINLKFDLPTKFDDDGNGGGGSTIGGEIIPIESTSLILAGAQSFSWMIPILLSGIGIGLFVVSRKSE